MKVNVRSFFVRIRIPVILAVLFIFSIMLIAQRVYMIKVGDRITYLQNEIRSSESRNDELQYEISRLLDTEELAQKACDEFGLRSANFDEIVILDEPVSEVIAPGAGPWQKVRVALSNSWETIIAGLPGEENIEISGSI